MKGLYKDIIWYANQKSNASSILNYVSQNEDYVRNEFSSRDFAKSAVFKMAKRFVENEEEQNDKRKHKR